MANGVAPFLLEDIDRIANMANPSKKVSLNGFLALCYQNKANDPIQLIFDDGGKREVRVRYRQRPTVAMTETTNNCDHALVPARLETTVSTSKTRKLSYYLSDTLLSTYESEAYQRQQIPGSLPTQGVSAELMAIIYSAANAILGGVNTDLLGLLTWGFNMNQTTPGNAAVTLAFPQNSPTNNDLTTGEARLLSDYTINGLTGRPMVVGAGLFHAYTLQQAFKGMNQSGVNSAIAAAGWDFFPDSQFATTIGAQNIGVFEPGSVHVVEALEYKGFGAGQKPGASTFFLMPFNYIDIFGNTASIMFDCQLRYLDCPTTLTDAYTGATITTSKGWEFSIKKDFGLFQIPSDSYRGEDKQNRVNGSLRYNVTNA